MITKDSFDVLSEQERKVYLSRLSEEERAAMENQQGSFTYEWTLIDIETTGLRDPVYCIEIAAQRMLGFDPVGEPFIELLNHNVSIERDATKLHGYNRKYLREHGKIPSDAWMEFATYNNERPISSFNLQFDFDRVIISECKRLGVLNASFSRGFCLLEAARIFLKNEPSYKLDDLCSKYGLRLPEEKAHRAIYDVFASIRLLHLMRPALDENGFSDLSRLPAITLSFSNEEFRRKKRYEGSSYSKSNWRDDDASDRQRDYIESLGGEVWEGMTKGDASQVISELKSSGSTSQKITHAPNLGCFPLIVLTIVTGVILGLI